MAKIPAVEHTYQFAVPPAKVFAALTQPKQLARWFVAKAEVELREGGAYRLTWGPGVSMKGTVKSVTAPSKLIVGWHDKLRGGRSFDTVARFRLRKKGRGTILTVTHEGFRSGKGWIWLYGQVQSGWAYYLLNLKSVLEHGIDLRSPEDRV
jgi:uncharacterized protein YndB with AHSA1/START domain